MSLPAEAISVLLRLPASTLVDLGRALAGGSLRHGFSKQGLQPFVGERAAAVDDALGTLVSSGFSVAAAGIHCEGLGRALAERDSAERSTQLVLTGPEVTGVPVVDTRSTVLSLFEEAKQEVVITSYVFFEAAEFFRRLAEKHDADPSFQVLFFVDLSHRRDHATQPLSLIAHAFAAEFWKKHWLGQRRPELWYDVRAFLPESTGGVLHAKTVIIDRQVALVTSANFTGAAQTRNVEAGVLVRQPRTAARLRDYFVGLANDGIMKQIRF